MNAAFRVRVVFASIAFACVVAFAGDDKPKTPTSTYSRFYVVRHAEKPDADDADSSGLTKEGEERAKDLATALAGENIDTIFVSTTKRTHQTAESTRRLFPNAALVEFDKRDEAGLVAALKKVENGHAVLVVWRHTELADVVNSVLAQATANDTPPVAKIAEDEYDHLYVVSRHAFLGRVATRLEHEHYGAKSHR